MLEIECEPQRRVERTQQELDGTVVARALERDPHRAEPVAERTHALLEDVEAAQAAGRQLGRELETVGHLLRPAAELLLARQPIAGRVQLDGGESLRIEAEKLGW